jgi:hypothetical protein
MKTRHPSGSGFRPNSLATKLLDFFVEEVDIQLEKQYCFEKKSQSVVKKFTQCITKQSKSKNVIILETDGA